MFGKIIAGILLVVLGLGLIAFSVVPSLRKSINEWGFALKKVDQETDYTNRKMVEDSARSMISNYNYAKGEYETYKMFCNTESYNEVKCQRALDSKTSANKTASTYNNYMLKNRFLFKENMPNDIYYDLATIN